MSNGLSRGASITCLTLPAAAVPAVASAQVPPAGPETAPALSPLIQGLLAVGICVLLVWAIRRGAYPAKLTLASAPGRPNRLAPQWVVLLYVAFFFGQLALAAGLSQGLGLEPIRAAVVAVLPAQLALIGGALALGRSFRHGVGRGMGLSLRHWTFDAWRALVGLLAVFPVCVGLVLLTQLLLPPSPHPMLEMIGRGRQPWLTLAAVSAVVLAPLAEELFFRGLLQSLFRQVLRPWGAILATSAIFAVVHIGQPQAIPALFALSVTLGYNYERTGRLIAPIAIHAGFNAIFVAEAIRAG